MNGKSATLFINGRFLAHPVFSGVQRFATEVIKSIDRLVDAHVDRAPFHDYVLLTPCTVREALPLRNIRVVRTGRLSGHAWEQIELSLASANGWLLNLCNGAPITKKRQGVVIHDASVFAIPESFSPAFRATYKAMLPVLARRAAALFTVSEFSRTELSTRLGIERDRLEVVYEGADHLEGVVPDPSILIPNSLVRHGYFLAVGAESKNKNLGRILGAFRKSCSSEHKVVITGKRDVSVHGQLKIGLGPGVVRVGHVTDAQLKALYQNALALVYPSTYEGFGLPPVEAMACGCPVIVGSRASLPEICGDAAIMCDSLDENDIARAMRVVSEQPELCDSARRLGLQRAKTFRWDSTTKRLLAHLGAAHG